ncbi:MAG TPA: hypothetical protein VKQ54_06310 [Caulobacteraceae bacterium]|jgi:hypothetical protein|nr:hypothetical protein [Caulobacteraceae bacterium]
MSRTLSFATPLAALGAALAIASAFPAAADTTIKVDVDGLQAPAAHAKILAAARAACHVELRNSSTFEQYYQWTGCINDAVAGAESQLKATASNPATPVVAGR